MFSFYRARKSMETRSQQDEERANVLEVQVDEAKVIAEEADRKYEEVRSIYSSGERGKGWGRKRFLFLFNSSLLETHDIWGTGFWLLDKSTVYFWRFPFPDSGNELTVALA